MKVPNKQANSVPKQPVSFSDTASTPPEMCGEYFRLKRKKHGWYLEKLTVMPEGLKVEALSDWDVRTITESKAMAAISASAK